MKLASLVPVAPLTDEVFSFNSKHILEIREYQDKDLGFLTLPPVRALVDVTGIAGDTATGITRGVGGLARGTVGAIGQTVRSTHLFGHGLLGAAANLVEQTTTGAIDLTQHTAERLVDPSRVVRTHIKYSNNIHDHLPEAMKAVDANIRLFSEDMGNKSQDLYDHTATKGVQIIVGLESRLEAVLSSLAQMNLILTQDNVQEELKIGMDKYRGIIGTILHGVESHFLKELAERLPLVIKTVADVKAAFETIGANLRLAKESIHHGHTNPNHIFAEDVGKVQDAWRGYEARRHTLTYKI
ncbi:hypothetical protein BDZ94DRAFT_1020383 [Collybia nuda]|uniref:Uncharacterized protein n=1 Tax=Collybia nuda TaxID=64659 RepID=A0A9P5XYI5_9AGAR|nr:hypothetical protein BDZ94DRAFT_1020383 [Collybia nuda]